MTSAFDPSLLHAASFVSVCIAGLVGSLHCVGMCGGFAIVAGGGGAHSRLSGQISYHIGRGVAYALLGALAGYLGGESISLVRSIRFHTPWWVLLAPAAIVGLSIYLYARSRGSASLTHLGSNQSKGARFWRRVSGLPLLLGLSTLLLPCPWLYSVVVVSALSGEPGRGAMLMVAFWLGSVPALLVVGTIFEQSYRSFLKRMPSLTLVMLVLAAVLSLSAHLLHSVSSVGHR